MTEHARDRGGEPPAAVVARRSGLALWMLAARPRTLILSAAPVIAGTILAIDRGAGWRVDVLLLALFAALAIQVGTNLWNDAADFESGVDGSARIGPPRVTALGLASAAAVKWAAGLSFASAAIAGAVLALIGGWPIVVIGLASLAAGYAYSNGPFPLSRTPLGEVFVVFFFGIVAVGGTYYLHTGVLDPDALFLGLVVGLPAAAVLLVNNHRDRTSDSLAGRRTLAILIGPAGSRAVYALLLLAALIGLAAYAGSAVELVLLLPLAAIYAGLAWMMATIPVSPALNRLLGRTGASQLALLGTLAALLLLRF